MMKVNVASLQSNHTDPECVGLLAEDAAPHPRLVTEHQPGLFFFSTL